MKKVGKTKISIICLVYNEEKRIERFIKSFEKYDEIIIIDKSSTDNTVEIAEKLGSIVVEVPYTDSGDVWKKGIDKASGEWVFILTASDVANQNFNDKLIDLINDDKFNEQYDSIKYPCVMHVMGIESPYSIFDNKYRVGLCKKKVLRVCDRIHEELKFETQKIYEFPFDRNCAVHHLSHENIDIYYDRQLRYSKEEIKKEKTYRRCFYEILREVYRGCKKRFWKLGHKGCALLLMMINYRILVYLRYFEKEMGNVHDKYNDYANQLLNYDNRME